MKRPNMKTTIWDELSDADHPYQNREYVEILPQPSQQFVLHADGPSGIASFHTTYTNLDLLVPKNSIASNLIARIRKVYHGFFHSKLLECGPALVSGKSLLTKQGLSAAEEYRVTADAIEKALALQKEVKADLVLFRDFTEDAPIFQTHGFRKVQFIDLAVLEIKWDTFTAYTSALKSRYRSMVKKHREKLDSLRVEYTKSFHQHTPEMFELWQRTNARAEEYSRDDRIDEPYFNRLAKLEVSTANLFFKGDTLIAFNVMLEGASDLYPLWLGIDYLERDNHALLFNIYYKTIEAGIKGKKAKVYFGETTYHLKMRLGCTLIPQHGYIYSRIPFAARFLEKLSKFLIPEQKIKSKNVWKVEGKDEFT